MIGKIILIEICLLIILGTTVLWRDRRIVKKNEVGEFVVGPAPEMTWRKGLKHDIITYVLPVAILGLPLIDGANPTGADLIQGVVAFLAFSYLKRIYWHDV